MVTKQIVKQLNKITPSAGNKILPLAMAGIGFDRLARIVDGLVGSPLQNLLSINLPILGNTGIVDVLNYLAFAPGLKISKNGFIAVAAAKFAMHTGELITCGTAVIDQLLDDTECIAVFARNQGANPIIIDSVKMYGVALPLKGTATGAPAAFEHCLIILESAGCSGSSILQPGQEATIIMGNDIAKINGKIKIGRPIIITIETGQGQVFTKQIRNGLSSGLSGVA